MLQPLGVHVLVEPIIEEKAFQLPELSKGQAERGIVRGIGPLVEAALNVGDVVVYKKYSPEEFESEGKTVYVIEEQDLMAREV